MWVRARRGDGALLPPGETQPRFSCLAEGAEPVPGTVFRDLAASAVPKDGTCVVRSKVETGSFPARTPRRPRNKKAPPGRILGFLPDGAL